jgi:hypothetical protein
VSQGLEVDHETKSLTEFVKRYQALLWLLAGPIAVRRSWIRWRSRRALRGQGQVNYVPGLEEYSSVNALEHFAIRNGAGR